MPVVIEDTTGMDKTTKVCTKCNEEKPIADFYWHRSRHYYMSSCKVCNKKQATTWQRESDYRQRPSYVFATRAQELRRSDRGCSIPSSELKAFLQELWDIQRGKCYYTGVDMSLTGYHTNKLAMTVDRKDSSRGYEKDNMVLCCSVVNRMLQNLTLPEFWFWADLIIRKI